MCLPCRLLSRIHCSTLWAGSVATLGSWGGPPLQPSTAKSSAAERHERLERELERLEEEDEKRKKVSVISVVGKR